MWKTLGIWAFGHAQKLTTYVLDEVPWILCVTVTGTQITPPVLIKNRESPILLIKDREVLNVMPVIEQVFSTSFAYHHHDSVFSQEPNINKHDKPDDVQQAEAEIQSSVYLPPPSPLSLSLSLCLLQFCQFTVCLTSKFASWVVIDTRKNRTKTERFWVGFVLDNQGHHHHHCFVQESSAATACSWTGSIWRGNGCWSTWTSTSFSVHPAPQSSLNRPGQILHWQSQRYNTASTMEREVWSWCHIWVIRPGLFVPVCAKIDRLVDSFFLFRVVL